jgi:hypothetical protein
MLTEMFSIFLSIWRTEVSGFTSLCPPLFIDREFLSDDVIGFISQALLQREVTSTLQTLQAQ